MGTAEANVWEYGLLGVNLKAELASRDGGHDGAPDFQRLARFSFGLGCALIDNGSHLCRDRRIVSTISGRTCNHSDGLKCT